MEFSLTLTPQVWVLIAAVALASMLAAVVGLRNMRMFARAGARMSQQPLPETPDEALPPVTVIVYAKNVETHIRPYLQTLLSQDYPEYEVIVVNDASIDNTAEVVDTMMQEEPRLRYSFVPSSSRNVSRRKVALTIGAKGARYPVLLVTNAHSEIPSAQGLRRMTAPFASQDCELSLGASVYPCDRDRGAGKWFRRFDSLLRLAQWMGSAMGGNPYRGDAYALAFRRDSFFERQGFASTNRFVAGEDDIFVNAIADSSNTTPVFHPEALLARHIATEEYPRLWMREKERYTFTQRYLRTRALRRQAFLSLCLWVGFLGGIAAALLALPNLTGALLVLGCWLLLAGYEICLFRRGGMLADAGKNYYAAPFFLLLRPLVTALLRIRFRANKSSNYTWKHPK